MAQDTDTPLTRGVVIHGGHAGSTVGGLDRRAGALAGRPTAMKTLATSRTSVWMTFEVLSTRVWSVRATHARHAALASSSCLLRLPLWVRSLKILFSRPRRWLRAEPHRDVDWHRDDGHRTWPRLSLKERSRGADRAGRSRW